MRAAGGSTALVVSDSGKGMPADFDWKKAPTLGLQLVNSLAKQVGGTVDCRCDNGTEFRIEFPVE